MKNGSGRDVVNRVCVNGREAMTQTRWRTHVAHHVMSRCCNWNQAVNPHGAKHDEQSHDAGKTLHVI